MPRPRNLGAPLRSQAVRGGTLISGTPQTDQQPLLTPSPRRFIPQQRAALRFTVRTVPRLDRKQIAELCKVKVIRRGGRRSAGPRKRKTRISKLGNQTWITGLHEIRQDPKPEEQRLIDRAKRILQEELGVSDDDFSWIKWGVGASHGNAGWAIC
jgi:hypothetical protein